MKNEEYNIKLAAYIEQLQELRKEAVSLATGIIGETLCMDDLFFCASVDRCIRLIDGLIPMLRDRNLTCVGVLLRIQMDNCMRTYAAFIAEDRNAVIRCILDGTPIKSLKDAKGNTVVTAIGAGVGVWGVINLMEGYGGDNPASKSQGVKQLKAN